jgi:hypothetical protein
MSDTPDTDPAAEADDELGRLADAITQVAGARNRIELRHLLTETSHNVRILTGIAANLLPDKTRGDELVTLADDLALLLRRTSRELPAAPAAVAFPAQAAASEADTSAVPEAEPDAPAPEM